MKNSLKRRLMVETENIIYDHVKELLVSTIKVETKMRKNLYNKISLQLSRNELELPK